MIVNRYILRNILLGTLGALLVLVSLALFFNFIRELDDLGEGQYGIGQVLRYLALLGPGKIVEFMPLAILLGSILSLGALANNSELIAMQASGVTRRRMLGAVLQAALVVAVISFLLADWVVPDSEMSARKVRNLRNEQTTSFDAREGLWIKDEAKVVYVGELLPNGYARNIEIYQFDSEGGLLALIKAARAQPLGGGWELHEVTRTLLHDGQASSEQLERLDYPGNLSHQLLQVLLIEPRQMSSRNLYAYLQFLDENRLEATVERLIFWKKMFYPMTIVIMCLLSFPFVMGSQRHSNTGQRLLIGILLGLSYFVVDQLLTQVGIYFRSYTFVIALAPNLMFITLAIYLLIGRGDHGLRLFRRRQPDNARVAEAVVPGIGPEKTPQVTKPETQPRQ
jgi:lipopolysaccharide export system permease protein